MGQGIGRGRDTILKEEKIQYDIVRWLQDAGIFFFSVANEAEGRSVQSMARLKSLGLRAGTSDLVLVLPKMVIFVEVKNETGTQSHLQEVFQKRVEELGHWYFLVRSVEDLKKALAELV